MTHQVDHHLFLCARHFPTIIYRAQRAATEPLGQRWGGISSLSNITSVSFYYMCYTLPHKIFYVEQYQWAAQTTGHRMPYPAAALRHQYNRVPTAVRFARLLGPICTAGANWVAGANRTPDVKRSYQSFDFVRRISYDLFYAFLRIFATRRNP